MISFVRYFLAGFGINLRITYWPVFLLSWLKWIFSESVVAGYKATGQVTRERRKKPFQLARGAMTWVLQERNTGTGNSTIKQMCGSNRRALFPSGWYLCLAFAYLGR